MDEPLHKTPAPRIVLEKKSRAGVLYQLELVKCGKKRCRCRLRATHGPYWYAYRWNKLKSKLVSKYVGRVLELSAWPTTRSLGA
jgi:hypothetical protein